MKKISILTGPDTYLDHLGVLSQLLNIPMIVTEEKTFELAKEFYPNLNITLLDPTNISINFLAENFDVIFHSSKFWYTQLSTLITLTHNKKVRFVYCPHGNSDKNFTAPSFQDISFVYGNQMLEHLKRSAALDKINDLVFTGNYRETFYCKNRKFYDDLFFEKFGRKLNPKLKTIFYAPTWNSKELESSFISSCNLILENLSEHFNVLIKLHPFLEKDYPCDIIQLIGKFENNKNIHFINNFPAIYPILSQSDIYIGDFSSIGYDYLFFNRPMFFVNSKSSVNENEQGYFLYRCGLHIPHENLSNIQKFIQKNLKECSVKYLDIRKKIYEFTFGEKTNIKKIEKDLDDKLKKKLSFH